MKSLLNSKRLSAYQTYAHLKIYQYIFIWLEYPYCALLMLWFWFLSTRHSRRFKMLTDVWIGVCNYIVERSSKSHSRDCMKCFDLWHKHTHTMRDITKHWCVAYVSNIYIVFGGGNSFNHLYNTANWKFKLTYATPNGICFVALKMCFNKCTQSTCTHRHTWVSEWEKCGSLYKHNGHI